MKQLSVDPKPLIKLLEKVAKDNGWNCGRGWPRCEIYPDVITLSSCKNIGKTGNPMWIEISVRLVRHESLGVFLVGGVDVHGWARYVSIEEVLKFRSKKPAYDSDSDAENINEFWQIRSRKDLMQFMRVYDGVATMRGRMTLFNLPPRL